MADAALVTDPARLLDDIRSKSLADADRERLVNEYLARLIAVVESGSVFDDSETQLRRPHFGRR